MDGGSGLDDGKAGQDSSFQGMPADNGSLNDEALGDGFDWSDGPSFDPDRGVVGLEKMADGDSQASAPIAPSFDDGAPIALDIPDEPILSTHRVDPDALPSDGGCGQAGYASGMGTPSMDGGAASPASFGQRLDGDVGGMSAAERAEIVQERERYEPKGQGVFLKMLVAFTLIALFGFGLKFVIRTTILGKQLEDKRIAAGKYLSHVSSPRRPSASAPPQTKCAARRAKEAGDSSTGNTVSGMGERLAAEAGVLRRAIEDAIDPDVFLVIESQPSGAEITVDGQEVIGDTPFGGNNPFSKGEHSAVLRLKGYQPAEVKFQGGMDGRFDVKLVPLSKGGHHRAGGQDRKKDAPGASPSSQPLTPWVH